MTDDDDRLARIRSRREPPPLRAVSVVARRELSSRMLQITFGGPEFRDLVVAEPGASVRLLVPSPGTDDLVIPEWNGNEFLLPDGERPALRTFTPLRVDNGAGRLDLEIVRHPGGAVSTWAERAEPGAHAAISGPGRGYEIDTGATHFVLLGDETALPAIGQLLEVLPPDATVDVHVEVLSADAVIPRPPHPGATVTWHQADDTPGATLIAAAVALDGIGPASRIWAAGEAASMQAIRTHLFDDRGLTRSQATIRGYWKPARS